MIILTGESRVADLGCQISQQHLYQIFSINFQVYHEGPRGRGLQTISRGPKPIGEACQCESNNSCSSYCGELIHLEGFGGRQK